MVGQSYRLPMAPRANYAHAKRVGDFIFISGVAARQSDNSIAGAEVDALGTVRLDIGRQTEATIGNLRAALALAGADLSDLCALDCYLVSMNDFGGFNEVYNRIFTGPDTPTRTTVAVHQLPHPHLLVEIKGIAYKPAG
ncbi:MAG: RidA family protein [Alphaproteobacteria bacterium]|nr:RidA family protein [Alphaproteobacteria bacterium]